MAKASSVTFAPELPPRTQAELRRAQGELALLLLGGCTLAALALFHLILRRQSLLDGLVFLALATLALGRILIHPRPSALWEGDLLRMARGGARDSARVSDFSASAPRSSTGPPVERHDQTCASALSSSAPLAVDSAAVPPGAMVVDVVYRDGVLVPVGPLEVPPGTLVHFRLVASPGDLAGVAPRPRATPDEGAPSEPLPTDPTVDLGASRLALLVAGLLAAGLGQVVLHTMPPLGLLLFVAGLGAFVTGARPAILTGGIESLGPATELRLRPMTLALALLLGLVAWLESSGNRFTAAGVIAWIGSLLFWLWAWWPRNGRLALHLPSLRRWGLVIAALGLIAVIGAAFRFYDLAVLPSEMTSDHAEKLLDVRDVLAGQRPIFFPRNTGREPAQFYLSALIAGPLGFGLTHLTLKLGTAIVGWLTVPLMFLAARRGLGAPVSVALIAAALLAISKWHVEISRQALRPAFTPLPVVVLLIFLCRAIRYNDRRDWLLAGLTLGLGLYGYTPFRIVPLLVIVAVCVWWLLGRRTISSQREALTNAALVVATALLAFIPLGHYSLQNPETFWQRSYTRVAEGATGDLWSNLWLNVWNAALMFHWRGDVVWVNTVPGDPFLDPVTGALFLLGLGFLLLRLLRQRRAVDAVLVLAVPILMLPTILAVGWPGENPSLIRAGGLVPVVMLIAAWPVALLYHALAAKLRPPAGRPLATGLIMLVLGSAAALNWETYFVDYRQSYDRSAWNTTEIASELRDWAPRIGGLQHAYLKSFPHWVDTRNVAFNAGVPDWNNVFLNELRPQDLARRDPEPRLVVVNPRDTQAIQQLERTWVGGERYLVQSRVPTKEFWIFIKPGYPR